MKHYIQYCSPSWPISKTKGLGRIGLTPFSCFLAISALPQVDDDIPPPSDP
jgi:hypothetical protein